MKRFLLILAALVVTLGTIGAVTQVVEAGADPAVISSSSVPPACVNTSPEKAGSVDAACRDYLYQVRCQFPKMSAEQPLEAWEGWCEENESLERGDKAAVPKCGLTLAVQKTAVGERCRDFLAQEYCTGGHTSVAEFEDFCANVAPSAGPDPEPKECTPEVAHETSAEGNRCWAQLEKKYCADFNGNTGAEDLNEFCEEVAAGGKPPTVNADCDLALAAKNTTAGRACKDQLYTAECSDLNEPPADFEKFCQTVSDERKTKREADEKKQADEEPAAEDKDKAEPNHGSPEVLLQLGHEPSCGEGDQLSRELRAACAMSGSSMHTYPFANYGIDNNVDVDVDDVNTWFMSLFQWLIVGVWQILIWLVKISLLILQWAFAVDPLSRAGGRVGDTVKSIFNVIGPEWRLTAIAVLGVWGFWNGLVRRQFMQTFSGLLVSMLLMVGAMWVVYDPEGTVGKVGQLANDASVVMLSATSSGELNKPEQGLASGQHRLFDQLVFGPWCALQFGGQKKCHEKTGDPKITRADLWLSQPANSSARELLYKATTKGPGSVEDDENETSGWDEFWDNTGDGICILSLGIFETCESIEDVATPLSVQEENEHPEKAQRFEEAKEKAMSLLKQDPTSVELQGSEGAFTRTGLLVIIAIGVIGAVAFFFAIGIRLLVAGVILLLLILFAPVMLIVAAFGEEGRRRFITWVKMLLGAAIAKLVYSVLFGLVLAVVFILVDLTGDANGKGSDWLGGWLLVSAFFWIALLQMNRVLSLFSPDPSEHHGGGTGMGGYGLMYMGQRMVSQTMNRAWGAATFLPRRAAPRATRALRRERLAHREGTEGAIRARAENELDKRSTAAALRDKREVGNHADRITGRSDKARSRIDSISKEIGRGMPEPRRKQLEAQRKREQDFLRRQEPEERWARWQQQSQRQQGEGPSVGEIRSRRTQREQDVARWREFSDSWSSESNRRWAGITDAEWGRASRARDGGNAAPMEQLRERSELALQRDRDLFQRANRDAPLSRNTRNSALEEWGGRRPRPYGPGGRPPARPIDTPFETLRRKERAAARRRGRDNVRRRGL